MDGWKSTFWYRRSPRRGEGGLWFGPFGWLASWPMCPGTALGTAMGPEGQGLAEGVVARWLRPG